MNFGKTILELRKKKNITQEELAAELGVTAAAVSKWENGYSLPDILMLCAIADYFQTTTDELLGRMKETTYVVIAAANEELGKKIEKIAKRHGIISRGIYTQYDKASVAAREDASVQYIIAGFYDGFYCAEDSQSNLICVCPTDQQILDGLERLFLAYLAT